MEQHQQEAVDLVRALSVCRAKNIVSALELSIQAHEIAFLEQINLGLKLFQPKQINDNTLLIRIRREERRQQRIAISRKNNERAA